METEEMMFEARQEIKRAEHLIYVSLKYTRTVDVIKSIIERLINAYTLLFDSVLKQLEDEGKIEKIPIAPVVKGQYLKEHVNDEKINEYVEFFLLMRKVSKADFSRAREFRRNVTMSIPMDGRVIEIDIDIITEYYKKTEDFFDYIREEYFSK